ncbi:MAG: 23S rRNA (pseudouridine(1915)-N(3))-methyltransferase RlmH [Pyrinomonadaceae bacterium]
MRVRFIWVGKTKNELMCGLIDEYVKRLSRFTRCEITEVSASKAREAGSGIEEESRRIIGALRSDALKVLLDVGGREWSSPELAAEIERWQVGGTKEAIFIIGGQDGVSAEVVSRVDVRWSLSRLTLTHEMARVVLLEQIYRAYTIIHGLPYQK